MTSTPKPIPHDEALEAFLFVARCTMPAGKALYENVSEVAAYIKQQKKASATRQADVATVREALNTMGARSPSTGYLQAAYDRAIEALDRLGEE